jgi:hypothetical protein
MALRIVGWVSGSQDGGPGSQKNRRERKMGVRDRKKPAIQENQPSGKLETRPGSLSGRRGRQKAGRERRKAAGDPPCSVPEAQRSAGARSSVPKSSTSPWRTSLSLAGPRTPTRSPSRLRSTVRNCETFTTLGRESPASPRRRRTFPGMAASRRFEVTAATTIVEMALRLNRSCWTTKAGRRPAGSEPSGTPKWSQYTSPWRITSARSSNPFRPDPDLSRHGSAPGRCLHRRRARSSAS